MRSFLVTHQCLVKSEECPLKVAAVTSQRERVGAKEHDSASRGTIVSRQGINTLRDFHGSHNWHCRRSRGFHGHHNWHCRSIGWCNNHKMSKGLLKALKHGLIIKQHVNSTDLSVTKIVMRQYTETSWTQTAKSCRGNRGEKEHRHGNRKADARCAIRWNIN